MQKMIAVSGSNKIEGERPEHVLKIAEEVGRHIAQRDAVLITGGRQGVMKAASKGAKLKGGITVGILPKGKDEANEYVDIPISTNLGEMRNYLIVYSADAVIAINGRTGTLNEITIALLLEKPLILIRNTGGCVDKIINGELSINSEKKFFIADSAKDAVEKSFEKS